MMDFVKFHFFIDDAVNFDGPVEPFGWERNSKLHFCPTMNGLVIDCLTELRRFNCSFPRSDMVSGLKTMLKDVLPFSLLTNLRLEGKFFYETSIFVTF